MDKCFCNAFWKAERKEGHEFEVPVCGNQLQVTPEERL